jgi:hypothetical protein
MLKVECLSASPFMVNNSGFQFQVSGLLFLFPLSFSSARWQAARPSVINHQSITAMSALFRMVNSAAWP